MFVVVSAIVLVVVAATGTIVATRLLRPLRQMRETADRVSARSLDERLPIVGNDDVAELADTMNSMLDRLDDALESQRRLLSDVGHELKTPITIVRGHLEVMDPDDPDDTRATRELAIDELARMARLVQDLADSAALHGPSPVQPRPVDVSDLVHQIARKASGIAGAEVSPGVVADGVALLDPARITQAVLQLVQNAVTHGGGRVEIGSRTDVDPRTDESRLLLWVRDHGPGVDDDAKARIFERFTRGSAAGERVGSGLGLNIVQVIARAHGGEVWVEDAAGGGARFVIAIPEGGERPAGSSEDPAPPPGAERPQPADIGRTGTGE
nr:HAMP domain-containing sensor histidine kinase [Leucobacter weissii]